MRRKIDLFNREWWVVDFVDKNQPNSPMDDTINKMLVLSTIASYVITVVDILNFILDSFLIKKLFDKLGEDTDQNDKDYDEGVNENEGEESYDFFEEDSAVLLLITTVSSFLTTMVFGKLLLMLIERYDPNRYDLTQVDMVTAFRNSYYAHWAFIEVSAFLVEDVATLCIYYNLEGSIEELNFLDVANIAVSLFTGIVTSLVMFYALVSFQADAPLSGSDALSILILAITPTVIALYAVFLGGFTLLGNTCTEPAPEESASLACEMADASWMVLIASVVLGMLLQFVVFTGVFSFALCPCCCVYWPTPGGLVLQCRLPLAQTNGQP